VVRFSSATPAWARDLVLAVCVEAGAALPERVRWSWRDRRPSSGVTRGQQRMISVVAGSDPIDQRLTLLHELAHWLLPPVPAPRRRSVGRGRSVHHDRRFYELAFALYRRHGLTDAEALERESSHYPSALSHARALGVPGADAAWRERRARVANRRGGALRVLVPEHAVRLVRDGRWTVCALCRQRIVGPNLVRMRRRGGRHTLLTRA
jgi:hypothetical protein